MGGGPQRAAQIAAVVQRGRIRGNTTDIEHDRGQILGLEQSRLHRLPVADIDVGVDQHFERSLDPVTRRCYQDLRRLGQADVHWREDEFTDHAESRGSRDFANSSLDGLLDISPQLALPRPKFFQFAFYVNHAGFTGITCVYSNAIYFGLELARVDAERKVLLNSRQPVLGRNPVARDRSEDAVGPFGEEVFEMPSDDVVAVGRGDFLHDVQPHRVASRADKHQQADAGQRELERPLGSRFQLLQHMF